ncbi:MAG: hypothetical protein LUD15_05835 [Bacteroides sp.]|nr:hypothetical protein [Bacteroides sp.]
MYGPLVLAGELGSEGMEPPAPYSDPHVHNDYYTYDYRIPADLDTTLKIDPLKPEKSLRKEEGELAFIMGSGIRLRPIHEIHRQRYVVYWDLLP